MRGNVTTSKFVVLVDQDSVLADFEPAFLERFKQVFPERKFVPLEERRTWRPSGQYTDDECAAVAQNDFYRRIRPVRGALEALETMAGLPDVDVYICTTPLKNNYAGSCAEKFSWVRDNLGEKWQSKLIITNDKSLIHGHLLFDDKHDFHDAVAVPTWEHVLFTDCHNKHVPDRGRVRLDSWLDKEKWLNLLRHRIDRWRQQLNYE